LAGFFIARLTERCASGWLIMGRETKKYLDYARECTRQAEQANDPERRDKLIELARVWMQAALSEQTVVQQRQVR
jgi:hypothetical protein